MLIEACVDSVQAALNAVEGGARRIELCQNLIDGGTTPSLGTVKKVMERVGDKVHVHVLIRYYYESHIG